MSDAKELTVPQRVAGLLKSAEREATLKEMAAKSVTITAITNAAGYQQCHAARMVLKNQRIIIEKDGKAARDEANKFRSAVIAEEARLIGLIDPEETRLRGIQDAFDNEQKRIKEAKEEAERQRVAAIQARITRITNSPVGVTGKDAAQIKTQLQAITGIVIDDSFAELKAQAAVAKAEAMTTLSGMHAERVAFEEAQVRAEEDRKVREAQEAAERERIAAEREELAKLRAENERLAEVERQKLSADRAEQEKAAQVERERIAAEAASAKAEADRAEADARKEREAAAAELKRQQDAFAAEQEAVRAKAERAVTAKQQKQRDDIAGLVSAHYKISIGAAMNMLQKLFS